jgi:hypothetical protein
MTDSSVREGDFKDVTLDDVSVENPNHDVYNSPMMPKIIQTVVPNTAKNCPFGFAQSLS